MGVYPETFYLLGFDADAKEGKVVEERAPFLDLVHDQPEEPHTDLHVVHRVLRGKAKYEAGDDGALAFEATVRVREACARDDAECQRKPPPPWEAQLRYRLEGSAFVLEPGSRGAYERLIRE
jgi:hypothetical protein